MSDAVHSIKTIIVKKLFGTYDYSLTPKSEASDTDKLIVLYGDNGSGKTTILKGLFHLLAPEDSEGHKSRVAEIPFQRFEIVFATGDRVWAQRSESRLTGSYKMGLKIARHKEATVEFTADENNNVRAKNAKHNSQIKVFLRALRGINVSLYLLSDDRTVQLASREKKTPPLQSAEIVEEEIISYRDDPIGMQTRFRRMMDPEKISQQILNQSLKRAESWIQTQVLRSSSLGESSVNTLYNEILRRLAALPIGESLEPDVNKRGIEERVKRLEIRSREYSKYGLLPEFNGKAIVTAIARAARSHISIIGNVLSPYLESLEKKLEVMEKIHRQIDAFVRVVNSFFMHKTISFEMHAGFEIRTENGKFLQPQMLSSGERHLLLLFCNTLVALDRPSIFIIDEPEISLNIKWQRKLLSSLMECVGDNPIQYILATHSLELLAQHKGNVLKLV